MDIEFNKVIESVKESLCNVRGSLVEDGELIKSNYKGYIDILDKETGKVYSGTGLSSLYIDGEHKEVHGNAIPKLIDDILKVLTFKDIKQLLKDKRQAELKRIKFQENNKYRLDNIRTKIENIYNEIDIKAKIERYKSYELTFKIKVDNYYSGDNRVMLHGENTYYLNDYVTIKTETEILNYFKELKQKAIDYKNVCDAEADLKRKKRYYQCYIGDIILELKGDVGGYIKGKNTLQRYRNEIRYSLKKGTSGKYYNCDYNQLETLIKKSISYSLDNINYIDIKTLDNFNVEEYLNK